MFEGEKHNACIYTDIPEKPSANAVRGNDIVEPANSFDIIAAAFPISKNEIHISEKRLLSKDAFINPAKIEKNVIYEDTYIQEVAELFIDLDKENVSKPKTL